MYGIEREQSDRVVHRNERGERWDKALGVEQCIMFCKFLPCLKWQASERDATLR